MIDVVQLTASRAGRMVIDAGERAEIVKAARQHQKNLNRLAAAALAEKHKKARKIIRHILGASESKLSALVRTIPCGADAKFTLAELVQRAGSLCVFAPINEPIGVKVIAKEPGNSWRPVCRFGWKRKALQKLCADILDACLPTYSFDFMEKGRHGVDGAVRRLGEIIMEGNYGYVLTVDVRNCFGSLIKEGVAKLLPLPEAATRHVLLIQDNVSLDPPTLEADTPLTSPPSHHEANDVARQGIPQGSSTSQLIVSRAVLDPLLNATHFADRLVVYADNIFVAAKSHEEAEGFYQALCSLFESNGPAGPLHLGAPGIWTTDYVELSKYKLKRTSPMFGGEIRFSPSTKSLKKFDRKAERKFLEAPDKAGCSAADGYVEAWKKAFSPLWQPNDEASNMIAMAVDMAMDRARMKKASQSSSCADSMDGQPKVVQSIA